MSSSDSELRTRIVSAVVLAPVALATMFLGGIVFAFLVVLVAVIAFWEWTSITGAVEPFWLRIGCLVFLAVGLFAVAWSRTDWALILIGGPALVSLIAGYRLPSPLWTGVGLAYVAIPCAGFIVLRRAEPDGLAAILYVLIVVWATDIAAYFGGRALGGAKLWARVSPKKTRSGALSGLAAAVVAGGIVVWLSSAGAVIAGLVLAAPLSVASQAGDLLESALKRRFGVKDSGRIIPGHGGVLDRIDGLFAAAALAWFLAAVGLGGDVLSLPGGGLTPSEGIP
ncbi:MAG TPA: phosphatidate cytidylyltransferase [Propylenella sp.]|nr:phosphatidate cytidylyltransferase [Propylenella sp.]